MSAWIWMPAAAVVGGLVGAGFVTFSFLAPLRAWLRRAVAAAPWLSCLALSVAILYATGAGDGWEHAVFTVVWSFLAGTFLSRWADDRRAARKETA